MQAAKVLVVRLWLQMISPGTCTRASAVRASSHSTPGLKTAFTPIEPVLSGETIYAVQFDDSQPTLRAFNSESKAELWQLPLNEPAIASGQSAITAFGDLIQVGKHLVCAGSTARGSLIQLLQLSDDKLKPASIVDQFALPGKVERLLAADGHILAVTLDGHIHALGIGQSRTEASTWQQLHQIQPSTFHRRPRD